MEIVPFPFIAMISPEGSLMRELNLLYRRPLFRKIRTENFMWTAAPIRLRVGLVILRA
jgi:hypothetical protein